jgi:hypothetical protein
MCIRIREVLGALLIAVLIWATALIVSTSAAGSQTKSEVLFWAQGLRVRTVEYETTSSLVPAVRIYLLRGVLNVGSRYYRVTNVLHSENFSNGILREYRCLNENGDPQDVQCVIQYDTHRRVVFAQLVLKNAQFVTTYVNRTLHKSYLKFDRPMGNIDER